MSQPEINAPGLSGHVRDRTLNPGATPAPTPQFLSPFLPRRAFSGLRNSPNLSLNRKDILRTLNVPPPVKSRKRRKLVLFNKSPMWNETSQVYQLDFGGRVTQESAKNFQIEFKETQVRSWTHFFLTL